MQCRCPIELVVYIKLPKNKRVLGKRLYKIVTANEMQVGYLLQNGKSNTLFVLKMLQENCAKQKGCTCFVDLEKALGRVPRKVFEWAMRNKGIQDQ